MVKLVRLVCRLYFLLFKGLYRLIKWGIMKAGSGGVSGLRKSARVLLWSSVLWFGLSWAVDGFAYLFYSCLFFGLVLLVLDKRTQRMTAKKPSPTAQTVPQPSVPPPHLLNGRYDPEPQPFKKGGMAVITLAKDHQTKSLCVVKTPKEGTDYDDVNVDKLKIEANYLKMFNHPCIVKYIGDFVDNGKFHLVEEYVEGEDLRTKFAGAPVEEARVVKWALQILDALEHIHSFGVVHRDVNPSNMMLNRNDDIIMIDFGTAKSIAQIRQRIPGRDPFTIVDKRGFRVYELSTSGDADERSDLCGLAQTCIYLLTSELPNTFCESAIKSPYPSPWPRSPGEVSVIAKSLVASGVSARVANWIAQALYFERDFRFRNAKAMKIALLGRT